MLHPICMAQVTELEAQLADKSSDGASFCSQSAILMPLLIPFFAVTVEASGVQDETIAIVNSINSQISQMCGDLQVSPPSSAPGSRCLPNQVLSALSTLLSAVLHVSGCPAHVPMPMC